MADPILTYLPPGWTEDKLKNATDEDHEALTEEQLQKVMDRGAAEHHAQTLTWFDEMNAKRIARGAKPKPYPHDEYNNAAGRQENEPSQPSQQVIDPAIENLTTLLDHVEQSDLDKFGFFLFRTHFACDDQFWETFENGFWDLVNEGIAAASDEFKRLEDKVHIRIVSDDCLEGQPQPEGVIKAYLTCLEDEESDDEEPEDGDNEAGWGGKLEPGLTTTMCLMIDEECIRSVVNKSETPFVKAVDVFTGTGQTIKVAIVSLIPAFYTALLLYSTSDVASKVSDDGIWRSIRPRDQGIEGRRLMELIEH
jgi:hypothetical protein